MTTFIIKNPFLFSGAFCLVLAIVGLKIGWVMRRYTGPAYRDENTRTFWSYIFFYIGIGTLFIVIGIKEFLNDMDDISYNYYLVTADSKIPLLENLKLNSPLKYDGKIHLSDTRWYVTWNFKWRSMPDGRCKISYVKVKLTAQTTLPKLIGADALQKSQFDAWVSKLRKHEMGHVYIAKDAENAIDNSISSLPEMSSCDALNTAANTLGNQIINNYKIKQTDYETARFV